MNTEAGFVQALREDPRDDVARLIFADWLDDQNDPRSEFFRVQVQLAQGVGDLAARTQLHRRSTELLAAHGEGWLGDLGPMCDSVAWRRGQPYVTLRGQTLTRKRLERAADHLFERAMVAEVRIVHVPDTIRESFVASTIFQYLPHLDLNGVNLGEDAFSRFLANPHARGFRGLALAGNGLGDLAIEHLIRSPAVETLHWLDLRNNRLTDAGLETLMNWERVNDLRDLLLTGNAIDREDLTGWRGPRLERTFGTARVLNSLGMELVRISPGTYLRGSPDDESGRYADEGPRQVVTISRGFYLTAFQTTQAEFLRVMGRNPSSYDASNHGGPHHPADSVSWADACEFCERLSQLPEERAAGRRYRLPTESEWEWSARCGWDHTPLPEGRVINQWLANCNGEHNHTVPVGSYPPTPWGVYDQSGNLWDWCQDWYAEYPAGSEEPLLDPPGPESGTQRSLRGASWYGPTRNCRAACRGSDSPLTHDHYYGFRVLMET